jgi:hypothetical protein
MYVRLCPGKGHNITLGTSNVSGRTLPVTHVTPCGWHPQGKRQVKVAVIGGSISWVSDGVSLKCSISVWVLSVGAGRCELLVLAETAQRVTTARSVHASVHASGAVPMVSLSSTVSPLHRAKAPLREGRRTGCRSWRLGSTRRSQTSLSTTDVSRLPPLCECGTQLRWLTF